MGSQSPAVTMWNCHGLIRCLPVALTIPPPIPTPPRSSASSDKTTACHPERSACQPERSEGSPCPKDLIRPRSQPPPLMPSIPARREEWVEGSKPIAPGSSPTHRPRTRLPDPVTRVCACPIPRANPFDHSDGRSDTPVRHGWASGGCTHPPESSRICQMRSPWPCPQPPLAPPRRIVMLPTRQDCIRLKGAFMPDQSMPPWVLHARKFIATGKDEFLAAAQSASVSLACF